jgi:DNA-binding winged helix-turn-helix (wHTH) protein
MGHKTQHLYAFDLFTLDPGRGVLYRDGEMIPLTQKALELLRVLVERSPETVS